MDAPPRTASRRALRPFSAGASSIRASDANCRSLNEQQLRTCTLAAAPPPWTVLRVAPYDAILGAVSETAHILRSGVLAWSPHGPPRNRSALEAASTPHVSRRAGNLHLSRR